MKKLEFKRIRRFLRSIREGLPLIFGPEVESILATPEGAIDPDFDAKRYAGTVVSDPNSPQRLRELERIEQSSRSDTPSIRRNNRSTDADQSDTRKVDLSFNASGLGGGRASVDTSSDIRINSIQEIMTYNSERDDIFNLSEQSIKRMKPSKLMELLADTSPELSRALTDFLTMCNPGWTIKAKSYKTDDQDETGQVYLDTCIERLENSYTSCDVLWNKMFQSVFLRGAVASEVVFDLRGRDFVDMGIIDPLSLEHRRAFDPVRGPVWRTYQRQGHQQPVRLDDLPQFSYIPLNPFFGKNTGRPIAKPALFVCFFLIATLQDLRRVIRQQGYPRIDITVSMEKLKALIPNAKQGDINAIKKLGNEIVDEVKRIYKALKPDDTYIHTEVVEVHQPIGALNTSSLGIIGDLLKAIERMATRALKSMPLLMATTDGVSEANANRQWEIYAQFIKSTQHLVEKMLDKHFTLALRAAGINAYAEFRFSELRASEMLRDAQVEQIKTITARAQYDNGSISADEMAQKSAGKDAADTPAPRASAAPSGTGNLLSTQAESGSNRFSSILTGNVIPNAVMDSKSALLNLAGERITADEIKAAGDLWRKFSDAESKGLIDAELLDEE